MEDSAPTEETESTYSNFISKQNQEL